jgi:fimbrial chaperone protein
MVRSPCALLVATGLFSLVAAAAPAVAGSLTVAPTTIELASSRDIGVVYVRNESQAPVIVQTQPFEWTQAAGRDGLKPSTTFVVSPPMARIAPGAQQIVRMQASGTDGANERSYRLLLTQLADPAAPRKPGVNLLLQFSVPVFVRPSVATAGGKVAFDAALKGNKLTLTARNRGNLHVKLTNVQVMGHSGNRDGRLAASGLFYILPGSERQWDFQAGGFSNGEPLRVEARDAAGGMPIVADVVAHRS